MKVPYDVIVDAVAVLYGDYSVIRKRAAMIILKIAFPPEFIKVLFEDDGLSVFDRNDPRVRTWKNEVLSKGKCERCGSEENLEAHHIIRWADYPQGRADVQNGMCLCHTCHANEHWGESVYHMMKATV